MFDYDQPWGWHFALPNMPEPSPKAEGLDSPFLVVIPIFRDDFYKTTTGLPGQLEAVIRSAIWARNSWLRHTDADTYGTPVKLYIEDTLIDDAKPILDANFITEADYIVFTADADILTEDDPFLVRASESRGNWGRLSKCMCPIWDDSITADRLIIADSDLYVCKGDEKLPFFRNITQIPRTHFGGIKKHSHKSELVSLLENSIARGYTLDELHQHFSINDIADGICHGGRLWSMLCIIPSDLRQPILARKALKKILSFIGDDELIMSYLLHRYNIPFFSLSVWDWTFHAGVHALERLNRITTEMSSIKFLHGKLYFYGNPPEALEYDEMAREVIGIC